MSKIYFILLLMLIGFSSCSSDSEEVMSEETLTEADLFVTSKEFQNYQNFMKDDAKMMRKVLKGLPKSKKERFRELLDSLPKFKTLEQRDMILDEIGAVLKIDYKGRYKKIEQYTIDLKKGVSFSNAALFSAMQRRAANSVSVPVTRSSDEPTDMECHYECDLLHSQLLSECPANEEDISWFKSYDRAYDYDGDGVASDYELKRYTREVYYPQCIAYAYSQRDMCYELCDA